MTEPRTYAGHAFYEGFDRGRASGRLTIGNGQVRFDGGNLRAVIPIDGIEIKLGGASDRLVYFSHPEEKDWTFYTTELKVLDDPSLHGNTAAKAQLKKSRRQRVFNWSLLGGVAAAVIAAPLAVILGMDVITGWIAPTIPPQWEQQLGKTAFAQYRVDAELIDEADALDALEALTQPLVEVADTSRHTFALHIVHDPELNAFALPGGYIVINSGLVLAAQTPDELLGVVAHEMAHVTEQHGVRNVMGTAGVYLTVQAMIGDASGLLALVADGAPLLLSQSYSRGFESEADEKAFELLNAANIDPQGLTRFFQRLVEKEQERLEEIENPTLRETLEDHSWILSTHPATGDRISALEERVAESQGPYRDLSPEFARLQAAVRAFDASQTRDDDNNED